MSGPDRAIERDGVLVGDVAVGLSDDGLTATIGYTVAPAHQGGGLATEAVGAVVDRLFHELAVHRGWASIDPRNDASSAVVEQLGFVHEGTASGLGAAPRRLGRRRPVHADVRRSSGVAVEADRATVDVRLVETSAANVHDVLQLSTHPTQRRFVAPMAASFADTFRSRVDRRCTGRSVGTSTKPTASWSVS